MSLRSIRATRRTTVPPQHRYEEPVGVGPPRRHQQSFVHRQHRAPEQEGALAERGRRFGERHDGERGMPREEAAHLIAVLSGEHRAGHIGDAAAGLDQRRRAVEQAGLILDPLLERARTHAPLGIGVAPPRSGAGAGRVDQHQIGLAVEIGERVGRAARRADLHIAHIGAFKPCVDRRKPALVVVGGVELPLVLHRGRERERLAAGAGAEIDHLLAGPGVGKQRGKLRAFVLDFDLALDEGRLGVHRRTAGVGAEHDAQTERRPPRRRGRKNGKLGGRLLACRLERIDAQVERRARGQRRAFRDALVAEGRGKLRIEPFRIVARDPRRGAVEVRGIEPRALPVGERRRRKAAAVGQARDRVEVKLALQPQHAEQRRARRALAHHEGRRRLAAQRVVQQPGNGGAVAGTGEAMRKTPILEGVGSRPPPRFDIGKHLDGGGDARGRRHRAASCGRAEASRILSSGTWTQSYDDLAGRSARRLGNPRRRQWVRA